MLRRKNDSQVLEEELFEKEHQVSDGNGVYDRQTVQADANVSSLPLVDPQSIYGTLTISGPFSDVSQFTIVEPPKYSEAPSVNSLLPARPVFRDSDFKLSLDHSLANSVTALYFVAPPEVLAQLHQGELNVPKDQMVNDLPPELDRYQVDALEQTATWLNVPTIYPEYTRISELPYGVLGVTYFLPTGETRVEYSPKVLRLDVQYQHGVIDHESFHVESHALYGPTLIEILQIVAYYDKHGTGNKKQIEVGRALIEGLTQVSVKKRTGYMPPAYAREVQLVDDLDNALRDLGREYKAHSVLSLFYLAHTEGLQEMFNILQEPQILPIITNYCRDIYDRVYAAMYPNFSQPSYASVFLN